MSQDDSFPPKESSPGAPGSAGQPAIRPDCRAKHLTGLKGFTECLTPAPGSCKHLFIYGHGRFCTHPLRDQIVQQG